MAARGPSPVHDAAAGVTRTAGWNIVAFLLSHSTGLIWKMANFIAVLAQLPQRRLAQLPLCLLR
jgi:hypothetical protein